MRRTTVHSTLSIPVWNSVFAYRSDFEIILFFFDVEQEEPHSVSRQLSFRRAMSMAFQFLCLRLHKHADVCSSLMSSNSERMSKKLTDRLGEVTQDNTVRSMQIPNPPSSYLITGTKIGHSAPQCCKDETGAILAQPFPRALLSHRRRTHVEEDGEHVCADTSHVCSSDRNCAVIQGSVPGQYTYAPECG
jgi:hypothetical protein